MWDLKYRPLTFADVLGQQGTVQVLKQRLANGSALDKSYIFGGGHGQGKTTLARILARAMLCTNLNKNDPEPCNQCDNCRDILNETSTAFFERDAASNGTIDKIRAIVDDLPFAVMGAAKRIYLFDEAHRLSRDAQDVTLKPIEDGKMVAILCTTEPDKIRSAIVSRCEPYTIRKVTREDILERMKKVLTAESVQFEDDAVMTVIDHSGGHVRDVLNRLEMIAQMGEVSLGSVREYLQLGTVTLYYDILLALGDVKRSVELVEQACERVAPDDVQAGIAEAAMNSYRLANGIHADFVYVDREKAQKVYERFGPDCINKAEFFLRQRFATRVSVVCDVVRQATGSTPAIAYVPPPVQAVPAPVQAAPPAPPPAPIVQTAAPPTVSADVSGVAKNPPVAPPVQQPTSMQQPPPVEAKPNGVPPQPKRGPLGSDDPMALTTEDLKAIPKDMPRRPHSQALPVVFPPSTLNVDDEDLNLLTPDEWRREFERTWPGIG